MEKVQKLYEGRIKLFPRRSNTASTLGHPCERELTYERTHFNDKMPHSAKTQAIFDLGNEIEKLAKRELMDAGFEIIEEQHAVDWKKYQITGHIDAKINFKKKFIPLEIKSINHNDFGKIDSMEDLKLLAQSRHWYHNWIAQIYLYCVMCNSKEGILYLKDKQTWQSKAILVKVDKNYVLDLIQKARNINKHVKKNTLPKRIKFNEKICGYCPFRHICLPDEIIEPLKIEQNHEIEEKLERFLVLKQYEHELEDLDAELLDYFKGKPKTIVGNFLVQGQWVNFPKFNIPKRIKDKYKKMGKYWKRKIVKIEED